MWTLTWHVQGNPIPICIHLWIERGTLLHEGSVVVEPKFIVWRESHSATTRKPMDVRMLNACRIVESSDSIDCNLYPMACASVQFLFENVSRRNFLCLKRPVPPIEQKLSIDGGWWWHDWRHWQSWKIWIEWPRNSSRRPCRNVITSRDTTYEYTRPCL